MGATSGPSTRLFDAGLILSLLALASCNGGRASTHELTVVDENGIRVATSRGGPRFDEPLFEFVAELTLRQDPGEPESLLYDADEMVQGPEGNFFVADSGNRRVAVFDSTGSFVRSIGREGQGPGEFGGRVQIDLLADGVLDLFDAAGNRTHRYRLDGSLVETLQAPDLGRLQGLYRRPDGTRVVFLESSDRRGNELQRALGATLLSPDRGDVLGELTTRMVTSMQMRTVQLERDGVPFEATVAATIPFAGQPSVVTMRDGGFAAIDGDRPVVELYDAAAVRRGRLEVELAPVPVTARMRDQHAERWRRYRLALEARGTLPGALPEPDYPETAGVWYRVQVDDEGYLWLEDAGFSADPDDPHQWRFHVLDAEGRYLGAAFPPAGQFRIQRGRLLAIVEDQSSGEQVATVYRMRPLPAALGYPR